MQTTTGATRTAELPLPPHFEPRHAREWSYRPDEQALFSAALAWRRRHNLVPAGMATRDVHLLIIDPQKDFCFPEGTLYVGGRSGTGAMDDNARLASFIYRNMHVLKNITTSMDTHFAFQIFSPSFWIDADGCAPAPHTVIRTDDVRRGRYRPDPAMTWFIGSRGDQPGGAKITYPWLLRQVEFYCEELEKQGRYALYLWPPHCLLGSEGHALAGVIYEACMFFSWARLSQSWREIKGGNPLSEHYSILRPEVLLRHDGRALAQKNTAFIEALLAADTLIIAGQAASHCVLNTIDDLLQEIAATDPDLVRKVYLLEDCQSAVAVPDGQGGFAADFTPQAEAALARFRSAGMHVVRSTDPLTSWPDLSL